MFWRFPSSQHNTDNELTNTRSMGGREKVLESKAKEGVSTVKEGVKEAVEKVKSATS